MAQRYKYGDYSVFITFKSQSVFSIIVCNDLTSETFSAQNLEIKKLKKQTIIAGLEKKNQKNISCQFSYQNVQKGQKKQKMIFSVLVSYMYLMEFREDFQLSYAENKPEEINEIQAISFETQIKEVQKILDSVSAKTDNLISINSSVGYNQNQTIASLQLDVGTYLFQISGTVNNNTGMVMNPELKFNIQFPNQNNIKLPTFRAYCNASYSYPFSLSEIVEVKSSGTIKITCRESANNSNLQNCIVTAKPVIMMR